MMAVLWLGWLAGGRGLAADGVVDTSFSSLGTDGVVSTLRLAPDNGMFISSKFTAAGGYARPGLARLLSTGYADSSFAPNAPGWPYVGALAAQADGKVLLGVTNIINYGNLCRFQADGSVDPNFAFSYYDTVPRFYGVIYTVAVDRTNRVFVGGDFSGILTNPPMGILSRPLLARLNPDGSLDNSFLLDTNILGGEIHCLAFQPDGKVLAGGETTVNGPGFLTAGPPLFRLQTNGQLDASFQFLPSAFPPVSINPLTVATVQPDGKIIFVWKTSPQPFGRVLANGTLDTTFNTTFAPDDSINAVCVQADGRILIAGDFSMVNGTNRTRVARLNPNGSLDTTFDPGLGPNSVVNDMALDANGNILIAGAFTAVNGVPMNHVARLLNTETNTVVARLGPPVVLAASNRVDIAVTAAPRRYARIEAKNTVVTNVAWTPVAMAGSDDWVGDFRETTALATNRFYRARTK
jgi:uncharacterized delta-60 repeat protein